MEATTQVPMGETMNATQLTNPAIPPSPVPSVTEMAEGGTAEGSEQAPETKNDGSQDWGQWIAILIVGLALTASVTQILANRKAMIQLDRVDADNRKKIAELEMNLKRQMGDKYESMD